MLGSALKKIGRLAGHLAVHPHYIPRYITHCTKTPLQSQLPWFSWPAIDFLQAYLKPDMTLFEYGSGGSTVFFGKRVRLVRSVEDNQKWRDILAERLKNDFDNVDYTFAESRGRQYDETPYVQALDRPFDVIVVDGSEEWPDQVLRPACFRRAERFIAPGGIIVLDDSWRYDDAALGSAAKDVRRFVGVGPGRFGVTRTDVYFY